MASKRILIHFNSNNRTLDGYVIKETRDSYFLTHTLLLDEKASFDLEGTQIVPKRDIFFVQVLAVNGAQQPQA